MFDFISGKTLALKIQSIKMAAAPEDDNYSKCKLLPDETSFSFLSHLRELVKTNSGEMIQFILDYYYSDFLPVLKEKASTDEAIYLAITALGQACNDDSSSHKPLNKLMTIISTDMNRIVINIQRQLVSLHKLNTLEQHHLDALLNLSIFLKAFQFLLPSSAVDSIAILLPLLSDTCEKLLKQHEELNSIISENIKIVSEEQKSFMERHSLYEVKKLSEREKLHMLEPPQNFRSLPILPTDDDVRLPCLFLRPNITKGKYKDTEHYLDVQFRLLREDYIKPLRDGITEYLIAKKKNESLRNIRSVRVYTNVFFNSEVFVEGDLLYELKFKEKHFTQINWKNSKRLLTGNLLCMSADDFTTMLFATVVERDPDKLKKGLLLIKFEELNEVVLSLHFSNTFVVIEVPALFESYRHNLRALQLLNKEALPMKNYIVDLDKSHNEPCYLLSSTAYDMRPLFFPLKQGCLGGRFKFFMKKKPNSFYDKYESVAVVEDSQWPTASEINLDESQFLALKSAITKEFAIIQGPPGTGKTYIGLRTVQLLLHNIDKWFNNDPDTLPILVVCYTNHALDQFLEGILMLTRKIVRIGGRGSNENIGKFQIRNLLKRARKFGEIPYEIRNRVDEANKEIESLKKRINNFDGFSEYSKEVLSESRLKGIIPRAQFKSLNKYITPTKQSTSKGSIYDWLEIDALKEAFLEKNSDSEKIQSSDAIEINEDLGGEGEADVEYIENERNVDFYDLKDGHILRTNSQSCAESGEKKEAVEQKMVNYIRNSLQNNPVMEERHANKVKNIWVLPINERWQLYKFWVEKFLESKRQEYLHMQEQLKLALKELDDARSEEYLFVIQDAHVVGMTTTGAAKYRHIIGARNPVVVIIEEAAEILESHIIASLAPKTQHVILIGDQQQLRPSPSVYMLAVKYGMDVSLFERMINNDIDYCRLSLQHRMRPEIAALIVPHIYKKLKNHETVTKFENIKGVVKSVFFVNHSFNELHIKDSKSKVNDHEASFIVKLCKYLILQGYDPSKITVLTTYSGQLFALKNLATDKDVKKVRFTVVDNFQGEENDIILISFVRSNDKGEVGFLKVSNRICVALSRAKKGLYCIGNFTLLEEKSDLWRNIIKTLNDNKSIGTSLRLVCQNHPNVFHDVAKDADFEAVPEGGCGRKCEYHLECGHTCSRFCHLDDAVHELFKCKEPCMTVCEKGHQCPRKCYKDCQPCPINVEKTLSKCGHTITAMCGLTEDKINCREPCKKACVAGHACPKKCFEFCGSCRVIVDRLLSRCKHTVKAECGKSECQIKCQEACSKVCPNSHTCPKKCYEYCGECDNKVCNIFVGGSYDSYLHFKSLFVGESQCGKICSRSHLCVKLCNEFCGSCKIIVEKTLVSCGHIVKAPCSKPENEIKCPSQCKRLLPCSHNCVKRCYEPCTEKCLDIVEIKLPKCGHSLKVACYSSKDVDKLHKKCLEPCKDILPCGHVCSGTCGACEQGFRHTPCSEACQQVLFCGHKCAKKCKEPCVEECMKIVQLQSSVCGHLLNIECSFSSVSSNLSKKCLEPCETVLPCGHTCKGTCGSCYQGRLHVACNEVCNKILICGHKCASKCCKSCPPCEKPYETKCTHGKCSRRCGFPCLNCTKPCTWFCSHKKCTRLCYEVCDRDPCNERCPKQLPCNHQCIGFCGEPCPKECIICDSNVLTENLSALKNRTISGYVYLEDCKHSFKQDYLDEWFTSNVSEMQRICMKTCPKCKTVVRRNFRFNKIIKNAARNIEEIKQLTKWDKTRNLDIQRNVLEQANLLHSNLSILYKQGIKLLSGGNVRNIHELTNLENTLRIAKEIEFKSYNICSMFVSRSFHETLINYARYCREWLTDFISKNFIVISEYQLKQLSGEVHRLQLLDFLLKFAELNHFASLSPEFEKCSASLMTFSPFSDASIERFKKCIEIFLRNSKDMPSTYDQPLNVISMSGSWYQCSEGHTICISSCDENSFTSCYKCKESAASNKSTIQPSNTNYNSKNNSMFNGGARPKNSLRINELAFPANKAGTHVSDVQQAATDHGVLGADKNVNDINSNYPLSLMRYSNIYKQPSRSHQYERDRKSDNLPNWRNKDCDTEVNYKGKNDRFRNSTHIPRSLHYEHDTGIGKGNQIEESKNSSLKGVGMARRQVAHTKQFFSKNAFPENRLYNHAAVSEQSYKKTNKSFTKQTPVSESVDKQFPGKSRRRNRKNQYKGTEYHRQAEESKEASGPSLSNGVFQQDSKNSEKLKEENVKDFPPKGNRGRGKRNRRR